MEKTESMILNNAQTSTVKRQFWLYLEGWLSVGLNVILFIAKYWVGMTTGSVSILADAWHTLSDSLSSVVVLLGAKFSAKHPDEEHPFGHGRAELIASIIIGVLLAMVAFNFMIESITKLSRHEPASFNQAALIIFIASVALKEGIAQFSIRLGKKFNSKSLLADGWHHRSDAIASAMIIIGILLGKYLWWIDAVLGIAVALLILYATLDIFKQSVNPLIGEKPDEQTILRVQGIVGEIISTPHDIHHIHIHRYGQNTEITFHIQFLSDISFNSAHQGVSDVERAFREKLNMEATIHYEPLNGAKNKPGKQKRNNKPTYST